MLVSVIMPVFNSENYLAESIESILNQTYRNFEFIIIDDGSTDKSYNIMKSYQKKDSRIKVIKQDNRGVSITLNKCIAMTKGNIIARQDADDISAPERLKCQIDYLARHPEVGLLGTYAKLIDSEGKFIKDLTFSTTNSDLQKEIKKENPFVHGSVMYRREVIKEVGMYREQFLLAQSYDMWLRISEKYQVANLPEYLYKYRAWENGVSFEKAAMFSLFSRIALECAKERKESGVDVLMTGNNFNFYMKYGKDIVNSYQRKELFRWFQ